MTYSKNELDIVRFIEKNIKLRDKPVKLYNYQKKIVRDLSDYRIINKSRQIGITWIAAMEALCYTLANSNEVILTVSVSHNAAKDVMSYIDSAYHSLPFHLQRPMVIDTKEEKRFDNDSRILSLPNNYRTVRGKPATRIYLDEYAHFGNEDVKMWESLMPSMTRGGKATVISTPLGKLGKYYIFWEDADKMGWSKHKIPYKECPDIMKRIAVIKMGLPDEMSFKQEYCCEFVDESMSLFTWELIESCTNNELENEVIRDKNPKYVGVDFGKKVDSTVITVISKEKDKIKVRYIKEFLAPSRLKDASDFIKRNYRNWDASRIVIDQTGMGEQMLEDLGDLGNIVRGEMFTAAFKDKIIMNLYIIMQDGKIELPRNDKLRQQLHALKKTVTATTVRYSHPQRGRIQHDDYVWSLALAVYEGEQSTIGGQPMYLDKPIFSIERQRGERGYTGSVKDY